MSLTSLLSGNGVPPALVGFARGAAETAVIAAVGAVILYVSNSEFSNEMFGVLLLWGLRTLEGVADGIDPNK